MTFQQSKNWNNECQTELSIVRPVSIVKSDYSIVMFGPIASCLRYKLSTQFDVTQHTASLNMDSFDAVFIDCRGTQIEPLRTTDNYRPKLTLVLVDEHTKLPEQFENNGTHVELITKAELGCKVLELRIGKYKHQHPQYSQAEALNSNIETALDYKDRVS